MINDRLALAVPVLHLKKVRRVLRNPAQRALCAWVEGHELVYDAGTKKQSNGAKHPHECLDGPALLHGKCGGTCVDEIVALWGSTPFQLILLAPAEVDYLHRVYGAVVSRGWVRWVSTYL